MSRSLWEAWVLAPLLLVAGCASEVGRSREAIINGTIDATHHAVVAVIASGNLCTGTIIAVDGTDGYVLTAAHCVSSFPPMQVRQGDDFNTPDATYAVAGFETHPLFDGASDYNFGIVHITGATPSTPVIPALDAARDSISVGTSVEYVGYGLVTHPSGTNSRRRHTSLPVSTIGAQTFQSDTLTSGPCSGDSGGPGLVSVGGTQYVGGVFALADPACSMYSVSGRVSTVYSSWIAPIIGAPVEPDSGVPDFDGGSTSRDAGTSDPDAGGASSDAGGPVPDAYAPPIEAGSAPDAGGASRARDRGGCGCGVAGRPSDPLAALVLALLGLWGWVVAGRRRS